MIGWNICTNTRMCVNFCGAKSWGKFGVKIAWRAAAAFTLFQNYPRIRHFHSSSSVVGCCSRSGLVRPVDDAQLQQLLPLVGIEARCQQTLYAMHGIMQLLSANELVLMMGTDQHVQRFIQMLPTGLATKTRLLVLLLHRAFAADHNSTAGFRLQLTQWIAARSQQASNDFEVWIVRQVDAFLHREAAIFVSHMLSKIAAIQIFATGEFVGIPATHYRACGATTGTTAGKAVACIIAGPCGGRWW